MREDQDAEVSCGLDEAGSGDRLAGRRRVAEAEAPDGAGVGARELGFEQLVVFDVARVVVVVGLLVDLGLRDGAVRPSRSRFRSRPPGAASPR